MRELGENFLGAVYILINMKQNDPLGDLIDNLIDVYVDNQTPKGVNKQLEPIINGLVELLQGEAKVVHCWIPRC